MYLLWRVLWLYLLGVQGCSLLFLDTFLVRQAAHEAVQRELAGLNMKLEITKADSQAQVGRAV